MTQDRELAACPSCGGEAELDGIGHIACKTGWPCVMTAYFNSGTIAERNAHAIAAWNRRTPAGEDAKDAEIARLNAALRYEQHRAERIGTHGPGCETWGPAHYECLLREVEGLRRDAERYRWLRHCEDDDAVMVRGGPCSSYGDELRTGEDLDNAIDAAMEKERGNGRG